MSEHRGPTGRWILLVLALALGAMLNSVACRVPPTPPPGIYRVRVVRAEVTPTHGGRDWDRPDEGRIGRKLRGLFRGKGAESRPEGSDGPAPDPVAIIDILGRRYESEVVLDTATPAWEHIVETYFFFDDDQFIDIVLRDLDMEGTYDPLGRVSIDLRAVLANGGLLSLRPPEETGLRYVEIAAHRVGDIPAEDAKRACKRYAERVCTDGAGKMITLFKDSRRAMTCKKARGRAATANLKMNLRCMELSAALDADLAPVSLPTDAAPASAPTRAPASAPATPGSREPVPTPAAHAPESAPVRMPDLVVDE